MKTKLLLFLITISCSIVIAQPNWPAIKSSATPTIELASLFGTPYHQNLSVDGWEDGLYISRDGKYLYCFYTPIDFIAYSESFNANPLADSCGHYVNYLKGPTFGMDLDSNSFGCSNWLHSDVLISSRNDTSLPFGAWQLSNLATPEFYEGGVYSLLKNDTMADMFAYTSSNTISGYNDILIIRNSSRNPTNSGIALPAPVSDSIVEDNPHIERLDVNNLVLFFDSDNPALAGTGYKASISYSTSSDDGVTWTTPANVTSISSDSTYEVQPHLYKDNTNDWWVYFTADVDTFGRKGIYRAKQSISNNWDSWINKELVISPGNDPNIAAIAEASLTKDGGISFLVVYWDLVNGTPTDTYDSDPWFLPAIGSPLSINPRNNENTNFINVYPNPAMEFVTIENLSNIKMNIKILNSIGQVVLNIKSIATNIDIPLSHLTNGMYFVQVTTGENQVITKKVVKK